MKFERIVGIGLSAASKACQFEASETSLVKFERLLRRQYMYVCTSKTSKLRIVGIV